MHQALASWLAAALHWLPSLVLLWLAAFFGRTLRRGATPLIERIARQGRPPLTPALCRYTRALTALWAGYFVIASVLAAAAPMDWPWSGAVAWAGTIVLFVGERWMRGRLFPTEAFPGLAQQCRDTWAVWRGRG